MMIRKPFTRKPSERIDSGATLAGDLNRRHMVAPLLLFLAGVLLLLAGLFYDQFRQSSPHRGDVPLPQSVAGLRPQQVSYEVEAIDEIAQLHGQEFDLVAGAVGRYGLPGAMVTLWISAASDEHLAGELVTEMEAAIARGQSPFEPISTRQLAGRRIYQLTGMGQQHFYFRSAELVIWLAADDAVAETALSEMLRFYP